MAGLALTIQHLQPSLETDEVLTCEYIDDGEGVAFRFNRNGLKRALGVFSLRERPAPPPKEPPKEGEEEPKAKKPRKAKKAKEPSAKKDPDKKPMYVHCRLVEELVGPSLFKLWTEMLSVLLINHQAREKFGSLDQIVEDCWSTLRKGNPTRTIGWQNPDHFEFDSENRDIKTSSSAALFLRFWSLVAFPSLLFQPKRDGERYSLDRVGHVASVPDILNVRDFLLNYVDGLKDSHAYEDHFYFKSCPKVGVLTTPSEGGLRAMTEVLKLRRPNVQGKAILGYQNLLLEVPEIKSSFRVKKQVYVPMNRDRLDTYAFCQTLSIPLFQRHAVDNLVNGLGGRSPHLYGLANFLQTVPTSYLKDCEWCFDWNRCISRAMPHLSGEQGYIMRENKFKQMIFDGTYKTSEEFWIWYVSKDIREHIQAKSREAADGDASRKRRKTAEGHLYAVRQQRTSKAFVNWYIETLGSTGWNVWHSPEGYDKATATDTEKAEIWGNIENVRNAFILKMHEEPDRIRAYTMGALAQWINPNSN